MQIGNKFKVDIAVLTALPIEVIAALKIFSEDRYEIQENFNSYVDTQQYEESLEKGSNPTLYHFGYVNSSKGNRYSILVAMPTHKGGNVMSSLVPLIEETWRPKYYFLIGIAMGFYKNYTKLGDLVIANKIICRDSINENSDGTETKDNIVYLCSSDQKIFQKRTGKSEVKVIEEGKEVTYKKRIISGTFFSSNIRIASTNFKNKLKAKFLSKKLRAGEMEALGIFSGTCENIPGLKERVMVIKGISDFGDDLKRDTKWRYIAAQHAVKFVKDIIDDEVVEGIGNKRQSKIGTYRKLTRAEYRNWLGEMQLSQGLFNKSLDNFLGAWRNLKSKSNKITFKRELIQRVSKNISIIHQSRGKIDDALAKSMISLIITKSMGNDLLLANSYYNAGRILRETELTKICIEFFDLAESLYKKLKNNLGLANTLRWKGYTKYKTGDYKQAYKEILNSEKRYKKHKIIIGEDRLVLSETYDMLGRCLREIANESFSDYKSVRFVNKPDSIELCILEALKYFWEGMALAKREGNYYRLAESYLSYVILFSYKNLEPILLDIIKNKEIYKQCYINNKREKLDQNHNQTVSTEFIDYLSDDYLNNIDDNFKQGNSLTSTWHYDLLSCLFLKHKGDYYFHKEDLPKSFGLYSDRIIKSNRNVRPQEKYRSFAEVNKKLLKLDDGDLRTYLEILDKNIDSSVLFSPDYFSSLMDSIL